MRLYYFTQSYPYGIGEQWKTNELNVLEGHFDEILIVPFTYSGNFTSPKKIPKSAKMLAPLFVEEKIGVLDIFKIFFHKKRSIFFKEFFQKRVFLNKYYLKSWFIGTVRVINLLNHPSIKTIIQNGSKKDILYFFWGRGSCEVLPFIDTKIFAQTFVRMHRYDLFEYVNRGYIPYRELLLKSTSTIAPSSYAGKCHLDELYPNYSGKVRVINCGTVSNGKLSSPSGDGILRIVSCALLTPVKRVHLQIECLKYLAFPVEWYHIGDGYLRNDLETLANNIGVSDKFHFLGLMNSSKVINYYTDHPFDLFVNVSESEGVPFSIMEAFSVSIPVLATDVGGSGEIVNEKCGMLVEKNIEPQNLARYITQFNNLTREKKQEIRDYVLMEYQNKWNAKILTTQLASELKKYKI